MNCETVSFEDYIIQNIGLRKAKECTDLNIVIKTTKIKGIALKISGIMKTDNLLQLES